MTSHDLFGGFVAGVAVSYHTNPTTGGNAGCAALAEPTLSIKKRGGDNARSNTRRSHFPTRSRAGLRSIFQSRTTKMTDRPTTCPNCGGDLVINPESSNHYCGGGSCPSSCSLMVGTDETDSCPLKSSSDVCGINDRECRYGLTDIRTPQHCPLPITIFKANERR